jgi:hypothetical protein
MLMFARIRSGCPIGALVSLRGEMEGNVSSPSVAFGPHLADPRLATPRSISLISVPGEVLIALRAGRDHGHAQGEILVRFCASPSVFAEPRPTPVLCRGCRQDTSEQSPWACIDQRGSSSFPLKCTASDPLFPASCVRVRARGLRSAR